MTPTQDWSDLSLIGLFRLEVETQMTVITEHLMALENQEAPRSSTLDNLMRAAHSIKGAARIVQVESVVKVAHSLEDFFMAARQNIVQLSSEHVDVLLLATDFISRMSLLEEADLVSQSDTYETDANTIVLSIEGLVTAALKEQSSESVSSELISSKPISSESSSLKSPSLESTSSETSASREVVSESLSSPPPSEPFSPVATAGETSDSAIDKDSITETAAFKASQASAEPPSARMIRMSAANLNRLMGLAGESLVESNWLQPFAMSLLQIKRQQQSVLSLLQQAVQQSTETNHLDEAIQGIQSCHSLLSEQLSDLDLFSRRFGQLSDRLYREVIASHMCAFEAGCRGYSRLVRDLSRDLGKQVSLEIQGLMTQVDRDILEKLDAPITHLLTNAVAHGIELPADRLAAGKPAEGKIRIEAMHRSGMLVIKVEDDGAGIDFDRLRQKIVHQGMTPADVVDRLNESELIEFLFLPGFSTAQQIDQVAGRGYGLDIARNMVQAVGGSLHAFSPVCASTGGTSAGGTQFQFQLPLTLSVVRSLLLEIAGEPYAMSLARIGRVLKLTADQISYSENKPYFSLDSENISLVSARQVLGLPAIAVPEQMWVVIIGEPGNRYGLWVDQLLEERDLVVRPLDARLGKVPNVSAAALTEKGEPILILDMADVIQSAARVAAGTASLLVSLEGGQPEQPEASAGAASKLQQKRVLVVDDSMTVRAMEKKLLQNRGYGVEVAVDGAEGWNAVRANAYDLVITDVDMPRMSGIELIEKMRAYEPTCKLPVIVVSYKDRSADQMAGLEAGANYYLTKSSFHDDGLINAVVDLIGVASVEGT